MVISAAKKIGKRSLQLFKRNGAVEPCCWHDGVSILTSRHHQLQRRAYAFLHSRMLLGRRTGNSKLSSSFHFLYSRFSYSTSSSSSSSSSGGKIGFLKWYLGMLETRPFITKSISSSLIFTGADITSQVFWFSSLIELVWNSIVRQQHVFYIPTLFRTVRIAGYGLIIMGPSQHLYFNYLSKIFPRCDVFTTMKKIIMGQAIFGPIMNSIFFSYNAALQGETKEEIVSRLKRDLLPTLKTGVMYWPSCDFLTFKFVPVHLQPLVNSSFAYLWTIYLTYMASLKKVGED